MEEILIRSTLDGTAQPSLWRRAASAEKRPLLVGLHTWSYDRFNQVNELLPLAEKYDLNLILPEFRGPNLESNPQRSLACGSVYAMQDIRDAAEWAIREQGADPERAYLYGASGGGHMALMMAGYCPDLFTAVAAFVPITDLKKWAEQNAHYRPHILACCGGDEEEMAKRSPMSHIDWIAEANVKIFHGKYDPSVPCTHSVELYRAVSEKYPRSRVFLDIFDGGHETDEAAAMHWFLSQDRNGKNDGNSKTVSR